MAWNLELYQLPFLYLFQVRSGCAFKNNIFNQHFSAFANIFSMWQTKFIHLLSLPYGMLLRRNDSKEMDRCLQLLRN